MATLNQPRLVLKGHDEIFFIDLNKVLYFLADDHYAHVYYASGYHCMVPSHSCCASAANILSISISFSASAP